MTGTPNAVYRTWFPAIVVLPNQTRLFKAKVFATDAGLFVYSQAALPAPVFASPILLEKTREPGTDYASEQRGHIIATEAGAVTVTKSSACSSCGLHSIKNFRPAWSQVEWTWGTVSSEPAMDF
jgi:hypothetical protein